MRDRLASTAAALVALAGCRTPPAGPPVPATPAGQLATFGTADELTAYLEAAGRARAPRRIERGVISEAEGDHPYVHVEPRVTPQLVLETAPTVTRGAGLLAAPDAGVWVTRERTLVRAEVSPGRAPALAATLSLAADQRSFVEHGLLPVVGGVVAAVRQGCGEAGIDLGPLPLDRAPLRICGRLVTEPVLARVGSEVVFYGAFDALGDPPTSDETGADRRPPPPVVLPSVRTPDGVEHGLLALGPVYYPPERAADLILRVILRCDEQLTRCRGQTLVSLRSSIDALWIDDQRVALGFAARRGASVIVVGADPDAAPRVTQLDRFVIGLAGLGDGRLAIVETDRVVRHPGQAAVPRLATLDRTGGLVEGSALPPPVTGREGGWTWAVRRDRFIYGPTRTHNLGGADRPRLVVATIPDGPVDARPVTTSVDSIHVAGDDAIVLGATAQGVRTVLRRTLASAGPWTEHAYSPRWSVDSPGFEHAGRALLVELGARRLIVVPVPDLTYAARFRVSPLELGPTGVTVVADLPLPSAGVGANTDDDRLAALALGSRLLLRGPGELVVLELDTSGAREVARLAL